jgi:hypothetical protein
MLQMNFWAIFIGDSAKTFAIGSFPCSDLFLTAPTYEKYIELDIAYMRMVAYHYPSNEDGKFII